MGKVEIYKNKNEELIKWIYTIRTEKGLTQEEFGKRLCHYKKVVEDKRGRVVSIPYSRNIVNSWEAGRNVPGNTETFVSLALFEYCGSIERAPDISLEKRQERYRHVRNRMLQFLGKELYVRKLNDVILMGAIRGIYSLAEVPQKREEFQKRLGEVPLSSKIVKEISFKRDSVSVNLQMMDTETEADIERIILQWQSFFLLGSRVVGTRLKARFEELEKGYDGCSFKDTVSLYAPRYQNSYNNLFQKDFVVSRAWLLELCIRMRLEREDINQVLTDARMDLLSDDSGDCESRIVSSGAARVGTLRWFALLEEEAEALISDKRVFSDEPVAEFRYHYQAAYDLPLHKRLMIAIWICSCLCGEEETNIPVDYFLDHFLQKKETQPYLDSVWETLSSYKKDKARQIERRLALESDEFMLRVDEDGIFGPYYAASLAFRKKIECYQQEFQDYYRIPKTKIEHLAYAEQKEAERQHACAAVLYSIFTGKIWKGEIKKEELRGAASRAQRCPNLYYFLLTVWKIYLGRGELYQHNGAYCVKLKGEDGFGPGLGLGDIVKILSEALGKLIP